jgi:adenylylsulfate kinase
VLDLGEARHRILSGRRESEAEQDMLHRALACAAKCLAQAGVTAIVDATAARRAWRQEARALIPGFAEVQLVCPEVVCLERERAARWGLGGAPAPVPGRAGDGAPDLAIDYEESLSPELVLRTDVLDPRAAARDIVRLIERLAVREAS